MNWPAGYNHQQMIIALEKTRDYQGAYEVLKEALNLYPTRPFYLRTEIFLLFRLNKIKEARAKAENRWEEFRQDPFFLKTYFMILEKEKAHADMERLLENIPSWNIQDEAFFVFLVKCVARVFDQKKAIDLLKIFLMHAPQSQSLKVLLENWEGKGATPAGTLAAYRERFQSKTALEAIQELENISALPEYARDEPLQLYLAELYKERKDFGKVIAIYERLLQQKPSPFIRKLLGYVYYKVHNPGQALVYLKEAFLDDPSDHFLYRVVTKIYQTSRDYAGYERLVNEALARRPSAKHLYGLLKKASQWKNS